MEFKSPLAYRIVAALNADALTADSAIDVVDNRGFVTLLGRAVSRKAAKAAHQIALGQQGVIRVTTLLRIDGPAGDSYSISSALP